MGYRTELPPHALAEIEADPTQTEFWEAWQAVGDAKLELEDAARAVTAAEQAFIDCRIKYGMRTEPGPVCGCGKHYDLIMKARGKLAHRDEQVAKAIKRFKKGK